MDIFSRTKLLIGEDSVSKLNSSKVAIFGLGGVGSYVTEGLVRAGVGNFVLIDSDTVSETNLNRQIIATQNTIGKDKVEVEKERILSINPNAKVETHKVFFSSETEDFLDDSINYIVDCVDTVSAKLEIIVRAKNKGIPVISCMGTGNKLDPTLFKIDDIYNTSICPLAKVMRKELRSRGIDSLKVLYSKEEVINILDNVENKNDIEYKASNRPVPGSISFVPSVAGLIISGEIVKDLIDKKSVI